MARTQLNTIAKVIARNDPETYRKAEKLCEPMLARPSIIPEIYTRMKELYPDQDRTDESIVFTLCVYNAYAPATLLATGIQRAPNGIRKVMCEVMHWNDAPVVNYYHDLGRAYQKVPTYKAKVENVLSWFEKFSIRSNQIELF